MLDDAAVLADGMQILRARGIESEAAVPFAGLLELVRPALRALERVPAPQAVALQGALALRPEGAADRFAVGAATLSLLAAHAEECPVLVLVDDAHWLDSPSAEALLFAIRRLLADPVAVVLAVREGHPSLLDGADLPTLSVSGLDRQAAHHLLTREAGVPVAGDVADRMYEATAGNPLALLEVAAEATSLTGAGLAGPVPVSRRITEAFLHRTAPLPERSRRALTLASASDGGELTVLARAAGSIGLELADLTPGEATGLVRLRDGVAEFRHPLARAAIYNAAAPEERRQAHRALAAALPDRDADRRAWHLASAAVGWTRPRARHCSRPPSARAGAVLTRPPRHPSNGPRGYRRRTASATSCCTGLRTRRGSPERSIERLRGSTRSARGPPTAR